MSFMTKYGKWIAVAVVVILIGAGAYYVWTALQPPKLKDTLIYGTTDSVESNLDPARAYDFFGWEIIQNTGETLVNIRPGSSATPEDFVPALATDWSVSGDGLTWTFTLREGVKFCDGAEFNATAVKYSFDRNIGLALPDGPQLNMAYSDIIDSVEVLDTYQVQFNLKIPFAPFLGLMACQASAIVNPNYAPLDTDVEYVEDDARASHPNDLGPYNLTKWERVAGKDHEMRLEANPNYWNVTGGFPKTKTIIIKFYADATALRLAIEAGDIDIAFRHITPVDIIDLQTKTDIVKVWEGTGAAIQYMIFQEAMPPFDDPRARRAVAAAINRTAVCETVFLGQTSPLYSIIPDGLMGHTEAFKELGDANYALTRSLLAELGYDEENKLEVELWYETSGHYPSSEDQALLYAESLEASGVITVTIRGADWPSYRLNRNEGIMQVFIYGWYPDYIDPDNYAFLYWASWLNHGYDNPDIVALYDQARAATDPAERIRLYAEIDEIAVRDCPLVPLWQGKAWAVTRLNVEGVCLDITQTWRMWLLYATAE